MEEMGSLSADSNLLRMRPLPVHIGLDASLNIVAIG